MNQTIRISTRTIKGQRDYLQVNFTKDFAERVNMQKGDKLWFEIRDDRIYLVMSDEGKMLSSNSGGGFQLNINSDQVPDKLMVPFSQHVPYEIEGEALAIDLPAGLFRREKGFHLLRRVKSFANAA